jgi:hypothetical protein
MALTTIEIEHVAHAEREAIWALLADVTTWPVWGEWDDARLRSPDPDGGPGVGAVRELRLRRTRSIEQVTTFDPPHRMTYALVGGNLPVRDYRGEVLLEAAPGGGTTITWRSTFRPKLPGTAGIVAGRLRPFLLETAQRLGDAAAGQTSAD